MWCSWGDQHTDLDTGESIHRAATGDVRRKVLDNIDERMVNNAVEMIEKHDLPIRTLILDDQWYTKQGDMHVDTRKIPDMRGLVDRLKARSYHVMAWTSLYQYDRKSEVFRKHPEWFIVFNYGRNYHTNFFRYIDDGTDLGAIPMVYTMLYFNADNHKYTDEDYACLKRSLDRYVARTPRFAEFLASQKK